MTITTTKEALTKALAAWVADATANPDKYELPGDYSGNYNECCAEILIEFLNKGEENAQLAQAAIQ